MNSLETCRVNVMVTDMDRAVGFYEGVLGLSLVNRWGDHYAEIQAPDLLIGLHPRSKEIVNGNNMSIGFGVTEFDETIAELSARDITFRVEQDGWIRLAYFTDPDGNELFLAERK